LPFADSKKGGKKKPIKGVGGGGNLSSIQSLREGKKRGKKRRGGKKTKREEGERVIRYPKRLKGGKRGGGKSDILSLMC